MLKTEKIDIIFVTEIDLTDIRGNFNIPNYTTFYPLEDTTKNDEKIRVICLARNNSTISYILRNDLMTPDESSIWVEARSKEGAKFLVGGFYRVCQVRVNQVVGPQCASMFICRLNVEFPVLDLQQVTCLKI